MKRRRAEGLPHSIQARLKAKAEAEGRPFAELLDLYGLERFIHRLATSRHGDNFVLKGALLIRHWLGTDTRPTRDIDLMGPAELGPEAVRQVLTDVLKRRVADDGLEFDLSTLRTEQIRNSSPLPGYRARFEGYLGQMVIHYQVDMVPAAFLYPPETRIQMAGILDFPMAEIKAYTPYSVVAEKLEAMVALGDANSRMKDYHDLAALARGMRYDGQVLAEAIRVCFRERSIEKPGCPIHIRISPRCWRSSAPSSCPLHGPDAPMRASARNGHPAGHGGIPSDTPRITSSHETDHIARHSQPGDCSAAS